jgi:3-dehydroquinate synthase
MRQEPHARRQGEKPDIGAETGEIHLSSLSELRRQGYRCIVDFGHTFSPALEAASDFALPHGFAVSVDMALSAALALERGTLAERHFTRIVACLGTARLPVWDERLSLDLCHKALLDTEAHRGGDVNLVVPAAIGSAEFIAARDDIDPVLLARSLDRIRAVSAQQAA